MKELKILHIFAPGPIAGAEKVVITGLKTLISLKEDVHCLIIKESSNPTLALNFKDELDKYSVPSTIITTTKAIDFNLRKQVKEFIKKFKCTHIHTHGYKALFYSFMSSSSKHIHTHHGDTGHTKKVLIYEWIAKQLMKKIDRVVAVSSLMLKDLNSDGIQKAKIEYIPNMLSICNNPTSQTLSNQKINLITIGRLSEEKGLQDFLYAFSDFTNNFSLTILGDGYLREELERIVSELNLNNDVHFKGFVKDIRTDLNQSDILVLPSHREGLPMTLLEASCSGKPVLASKVGGIPDIVKHMENGFLFAPRDIEEMKKSLQYTLENLEVIKENSQKKAVELNKLFAPINWANTTMKLYKSL